MKYLRKNLFAMIMMSIGILLCLYPSLHSLYERYCHEQLIKTYHVDVEKAKKVDVKKELDESKSYNEILFRSRHCYLTSDEKNVMRMDHYHTLLNLNENGIMAEIVIPKISVDLPIYHGTTETILEKGIGHVYGSSLPVGGKNTRCLLTGHRGLPSSMLFTRLDELKKNDTFYINVLNQTIWYRIEQIEVILPTELDELKIKDDEDLVSLITCTPYGLNSHRLVVTGKAFIPKKDSSTHIQKAALPGYRELIFSGLPFLFILFIMLYHKRRRLRRTKDDC